MIARWLAATFTRGQIVWTRRIALACFALLTLTIGLAYLYAWALDDWGPKL